MVPPRQLYWTVLVATHRSIIASPAAQRFAVAERQFSVAGC
ncbi:hypothetical protein RMSM_01116 [Rhodopirellula maiorica SM1]|uniref:Uncharacterized protein n=1 Tax=Rhodopirellula maiorica SM1 TaxID=1265738 RepID=M5RRP0_9BACT|nr:hypothetical protein RMSM_01116 [Rhodopirellula maiorica SM1]